MHVSYDNARKCQHKIILRVKGSLDQMELAYIYRTFHPKATEYTFFSSAHGTFLG